MGVAPAPAARGERAPPVLPDALEPCARGGPHVMTDGNPRAALPPDRPAPGTGDRADPGPPVAGAPSRQVAGASRILVRVIFGLIGLALTGCLVLVVVVSIPNPTVLWLSLGAATLPALVYSLLVVSLDRHEREPWRVLLGAFGWGAVVATLLSLLVSVITGRVLSAAYGASAGYLLSAGIGAPVIEESFKGAALLILLVFFRDEFDNILDGLVYGALIGLGFAMTENVLYFGQAYYQGGLAELSQLFVARAVLGGFGHALYTATTGAGVGWARGRDRGSIARWIAPVFGWSLAVFQHFLWNTGAIALGALYGGAASLVALVAAETVVFTVPGLVTLYVISRVAARRELAVMRIELALEVAAGTLTRAEFAILTEGTLRWQASLAALRSGGIGRWLLLQRFFQAGAELAFRMRRRRQERSPAAHGEWAAEQAYRAQLHALRARLGGEVNLARLASTSESGQ